MPRFVLATCLMVIGSLVAAADEATMPPSTVMVKPGKLIFRDEMKAMPDKQNWRQGPGSWTIADNALRGAERADDKHGAVLRHPAKFTNAIIRYDFKLDGAKMTTLSINDQKEHVCRVLIRPDEMSVRKDDHDHDGPDKAVLFETRKIPLKAGEWHTLVVELQGPEIVATIDGKHTAFGSHELLKCEKANFGFTVAGESASFRNVEVWEAIENSDWPAKKAELEKVRAENPAPKQKAAVK